MFIKHYEVGELANTAEKNLETKEGSNKLCFMKKRPCLEAQKANEKFKN